MKLLSVGRTLVLTALLAASVAQTEGRTPKEFANGSDLTNPNNYSPAGLPSNANDVLLLTGSNSLSIDATTLNMGSLNTFNAASYTISNNTAGSTNSTLNLGGGDGVNSISGVSTDLIYTGAATSTFTFERINGGNGIGQLGVFFAQGGTLNVAQSGAMLDMKGGFGAQVSSQVTKIGRGTMRISGVVSGMGSVFGVNDGVLDILPGASTSGTIALAMNPSSGASAVINVWTSIGFRALSGSPGQSSTATVNVIGAGTLLSLGGSAAGTFGGVIAGDGSVRTSSLGGQVFTGNNTYSGTTTVGIGSLLINGTTSGQGTYTVVQGAFLGGTGTIGLAQGASVVGGPLVTPDTFVGRYGTLRIEGSGGVAVARPVLQVDVGPNGVSDLFEITGGALDLTGGSSLSISSQSGAFDGNDYTIMTFPQNLNGGTFGSVTGLQGGYTVQYNPTSIKLIPPQLPLQVTAAASRKTHGPLGPGPWDVNLLTSEPVECRLSNGSHTLVFTFSNVIVSGAASITAGVGQVSGAPTFSGKTMTVNLSDVPDVQRIVVTLQKVTDRYSQVLPPTSFAINLLAGDVNGDRFVNAGDAVVTRNGAGAASNATNFRSDVNADGVVNSGDTAVVRSRAGAGLP